MAIETLEVRMLGKSQDFTDDLDKAEKGFGKFKNVVSGMAMGVGIAVVDMALQAGQALLQFGADSVTAASDMNETLSKTEVLFGDNAESVQAWADSASTAFGQSKQMALNAAATFATFGRAAGLTGQDLESFSTDFVELSSDLASFNNTSPEQAIEAIGAALRGESEPLRAYGVLLDDASMRQKALAMGLIETTKEALTPQQKVLAAQALIYEQTATAQGDFARTSDGLANQQRILDAQWANMQATLGQALLPVVLAFTSLMNDLLQAVLPGLQSSISALAPAFHDFGGFVTALFDAFVLGKPVFEDWNGGLSLVARLMGDEAADSAYVFLESLKDLRSEIANQIGPIVDWLGNVITNFAGQTGPAIGGAVDVAKPMLEWFGQLFRGLGETISQFVNQNLNFFKVWIDQNMPRIQQIVSTVLSAIADFWETHGQTIMDSIQRYFGWIMDFWSLAFRTLLNVVQVFLQVLTGDWEGAGETLKTTVQDMKTSLTRIFSQMIDAIIDLWTSVDWGGIGRAMIEGIANGLRNAAGWLRDAAWNAAMDALRAAQNALGIHSPSTVAAEEIGRPFAEGIGVGMDRALGGLTRSMDAMLGGMVGGLSVPEMAPAGATVSITQQFYGQADGQTVRQASQDGVLAALRAAGLSG